MLIKQELTKEKQPANKEISGQRISDIIRQIQVWAKETYKGIQTTPEFKMHSKVPGYPTRVRVYVEENPDQLTIVVPDNEQSSVHSLRLWARFNNQPEFYFYDLKVGGKQNIEVTEVQDDSQIEVEPMIKTLIIDKAGSILEQSPLTLSLERKVYNKNPVGQETIWHWQILKTETISII